ncbi:LD-carboxypeptidase [candidate division KSB1 bacterium]|nr:LD-carboxypeptidase [candidate division KSB1 bacterium]
MHPVRLKPGDTIGIVSPSTPVTQNLEQQFQSGMQYLKSLGFNIKEGKSIRSTSWGYCASPQEKADDINTMFADQSVQAIVCSQGGETTNACLPYIDWKNIRNNPKIFVGISDISVLLNAIYYKTGLITFHGNDIIWGWGRTPTKYDRDGFISRLVDGHTGSIQSNGARQTIRSGCGEGKLLGGNLRCLLKLAGTEFFPDLSDAIYFVEAMNIIPEECDCLFQQLRQLGVFDKIRGVIVGYIYKLQRHESRYEQMEQVLVRVTADYGFPILKVNDFGHNCPNTVIPIGSTVRMDADKQIIEIVEGFIE